MKFQLRFMLEMTCEIYLLNANFPTVLSNQLTNQLNNNITVVY